MYHFGVLLSHHQGTVLYPILRMGGVEFLNIKASEGKGYIDPTYNTHVSGGRAEGMGIIAFHYWRPVGVKANFDTFMTAIKDNTPDILEIDWEEDGTSILSTVSELTEFSELVRMRTRQLPLLYTNPDFGNRYYSAISYKLFRLPLHVAHYDRGFPAQVKPWLGWDVWQSTQRGRLAGMKGNVCIEVLHNDFDSLVRKTKRL